MCPKNIVERDRRALNRVTRPMLNFESFRSSENVSPGLELMHMIRTGQMIVAEENQRPVAEQWCALAGQIRLVFGTGIFARPKRASLLRLMRQNRVAVQFTQRSK